MPVLYPAWAWARARRHADPAPPQPREWPPLTAVVPAYREAAAIAAKVDDLRANGYPGELEIVVVADDPATAAAARAAAGSDDKPSTPATGSEQGHSGAAVRVIEPGRRIGKAAALNLGIAAAGHEVVAMSDANTELAPGSLAALARWFDDPAVGAVAGEKRVRGAGQGAYWRFESQLKRLESRSGSTIGLVGELGAVRRSAFRELPHDLAVDDMWLALDVIEAGLRVVYEPAAVATEDPSPTLADEWQRRTRVTSGVLDNSLRRRALLLPGRNPVTAQLWGHRFLRTAPAPLANALLLAYALARAPRSAFWAAFALAHAFGALAVYRQAHGAALSTPERLAAQYVFLQAVGVGGTARYLRRERLALWPKPERGGG